MSLIWSKKNNVWKFRENVMDYSIFSEFNKKIDTPNKAILYMPVHNVNDIYEWYRIFYDAYYFKDSTAKNYIDNIGHGIGITLYANKDKAKTIKAWYPNLIEVKASSSDEQIYIYDSGVYRYSKDFINNIVLGTVNVGIDNFYIDDTLINPGERILLKNQFKHELQMFGLQTIPGNNGIIDIDDIDKVIKIYIDSDTIENFNVLIRDGSTLICSRSGVYSEYEIDYVSISDYDPITNNEYLMEVKIKIDQNETILDITAIGDKFNGNYILDDSFMVENGVYDYTGEELSLTDEMKSEYTVYNQLVYTYQGLTNQNNTYYLRRHEVKFSENYTKYPWYGLNLPLIYSKGDPYLVECEVNYDIAMTPIINDGQPFNCGVYNMSFNYLEHPQHDGPYTYDDNIFRLLFTDYDMARKLQTKSSIGPAHYKFSDDLVLMDIDSGNESYAKNIIFYNNGTNHYLNLWANDKNFSFNDLTFTCINSEQYTQERKYFEGNLNFNMLSPIPINNGIEIVDFEMTINMPNDTHPVTDWTLPITDFGYVEDTLLDLKIEVYDTNTSTVLNSFNDIIYANNIEKTGAIIKFKSQVPFKDEIANDLFYNYIEIGTNTILPNIEFRISIDFITSFEFSYNSGDLIGEYSDTLSEKYKEYMSSFIESVNKTIIGHVYDFSYKTGMTIKQVLIGSEIVDVEFPNTVILDIRKIRNNFNKYIYDSLLQTLEVGTQSVNIETAFKNIYTRSYDLIKYLEDYVGYDSSYIFDVKDTGTFNFNNDVNDPEYFYIYENASIANYGTTIKYGEAFKNYFIKNIKSNSFCKITDESGDLKDTFIISNDYNFETKIGTIILNRNIHGYDISFTNNYLDFDPNYTIYDLSNLYYSVFSVTNNIGNINYETMKPSTYSLGNDIINSRGHFRDITGVVYKEFNEPVYTFLKRDKKFRFNEDPIINVDYVIEDNVGFNINLDEIEIDIIGYLTTIFIEGNRIILKDQLDKSQNGLFEVILVDPVLGVTTLKRLDVTTNIYYKNGSNGSLLYSFYEQPYILNQSDIYFFDTKYRKKSDPRLNISFIKYAKLGVDNEHQPFVNINHNRDSIEIIENLVSVGNNINGYNQIRFIDGLSYDNIINNYNGQGQYAWILHENVVTENAVVGIMLDQNGDEKLVWYKGKWVDGVWCDGIWIQGEWENGIWVNGIKYSYGITDNISSVTINYNVIISELSIWKNGRWLNGTSYNGIFENVQFENGSVLGGYIETGTWYNGIFNGTINLAYSLNTGYIKNIKWMNGTFNGGWFETGIWYNGTFNAGIFGKEAINTIDYSTKAIFFNGVVNGGTFTTLMNQHNATIIYSGIFKGILENGTIVLADFNGATINGGFIIGGYYLDQEISGISGTSKFKVEPYQWDALLELNTLIGYTQTNEAYILPYIQNVSLFGKYTTPGTIFLDDKFETIFNNGTNTGEISNYLIPVNVNSNLDIIYLDTILTMGVPSENKNRPYITIPITDITTNINGGIFYKCFIKGNDSLDLKIKNATFIETLLDKIDII